MTQAWAPEQAKTDVGEDGDILTPLKRIRDKYCDRVEQIAVNAAGREFTEKENRSIAYYSNAAFSVRILLEQ
jgi:hypothetical protein